MPTTSRPAVIVNFSHLAAADHQAAAATAVADTAQHDPAAAALMQSELTQAFADLEAAEITPDVQSSPDSAVAAALQSYLAHAADRAGQLAAVPGPSGAREVKMDPRDLLGWLKSFFTWWRRLRPAPWLPPPSAPERLASDARLAVLSDWGSGRYGAPVSAATIAGDAGPIAAVLHLGDTYYSGMPEEVQSQVLPLWPHPGAAIGRALNGNHEMYSGGHGYFQVLLPALQQTSSVVWLQNDHFVVLGLDTSYHGEYHLGPEQSAWLHKVVQEAGARRIILCSHHQPVSLFEEPKAALQADVAAAFAGREAALLAWYWGHEHRALLFDPGWPGWSTPVQGRCVGFGGFPEFRGDLSAAPLITPLPQGCAWRRVARDGTTAQVLDGPNPYIPGHEDAYLPHGFLLLHLSGGSCTERLCLPDGTLIHEQRIA